MQRELAWAEEMKRERERFGLEPGPHWQQQFGDRRISFLPRNVCFPIPLPLPLQTNHLKQKRHAHTMLHDFFRVMRMQWENPTCTAVHPVPYQRILQEAAYVTILRPYYILEPDQASSQGTLRAPSSPRIR